MIFSDKKDMPLPNAFDGYWLWGVLLALGRIVAAYKPVKRLLAPVRIVAVNKPVERLLALARSGEGHASPFPPHTPPFAGDFP